MKSLRDRFPTTLRARIVLLALMVGVFTGSTTIVVNYFLTRSMVRESAVAQFAGEAESTADRIHQTFDLMELDVVPLAHMAVLQRFAEALRSDANPAAMAVLRQQLEAAMVAVLARRPYYTNISFMGPAPSGREYFRAVVSDGGIGALSAHELDTYRDSLPDSAGDMVTEGQFNFAPVRLEHPPGSPAEPGVPTLRLTLPVLDHRAEVIGYLVIGADYEKMLGQVLALLSRGIKVTVMDRQGDTITKEAATGQIRFRSAAMPEESSALARRMMKDTANRAVLTTSETIAYFARTRIAGAMGTTEIGVLVESPTTAAFATAESMFHITLAVQIVTILLVTMVAGIFGKRLMQPLGNLTQAIKTGRIESFEPGVPAHAPEEVTSLSAAFGALTRELAQSTMGAKALLDNAPDGMVQVDSSGVIRLANEAMGKMFGYPIEELEGSPLSMLIPQPFRAGHATHFTAEAVNASARPMAQNRDVTGQRRDGSEFPIEVSVGQFSLDDTTWFIGVVRDITQRKQSEIHTQSLLKALKNSNKELDGFAFVASHDLKAPLRVIDNASKWLEEDLEPYLNDDTRESMTLLRNRVARMDRLLDDLLAHSRIGRTPVNTKMISGAELMQDVTDLSGLPPGFSLQIDPAIEAIEVPRMPIRNVLLNLVTNAVKHHDRASGTIAIRVADRGEMYEFSVEDDGPGIAPEFHERVFGMFQTLKPRDQVEGSGMGLAMVRKNVEVMGGTITLISDGTRGSIFKFTWPKTGKPHDEREHEES